MIFIRRKKIEIFALHEDRSMMCRIVFTSRKKEQERPRKKVKWKKRKEDSTIAGAMIRSLISNMKLTKLDCTFGNRQHEALSLCSFHRAISAFTSVKENDSPGQFGLSRYRVRSNWDRSSV